MAGVGDVGMQLCAANVPYGLAKIHHVQEAMGGPADATFVGAPDATVTRNDRRWSQGFGYGGMYSWTGDFAVLDLKPNACGMSAGVLSERPELDDIRARLHQLEREPLSLDGVRLDNDFCESNHFVDVFRVSGDSEYRSAPGGAEYMYIMHSSGHEHRQTSPFGPGLYWDKSQQLMALARRFDTPWGSLHILEAEHAEEWYRFYQQVQDFNHRRRALLGRFLFGDHEVVINATHQGMVQAHNRANIGCYTFTTTNQAAGQTAGSDPDASDDRESPTLSWDQLFPLTLSPVLPAYLVLGQANFGDVAIEQLGWRERIERHGLYERIAGQNILPHGGGYNYPHLRGVTRVLEDRDGRRRFELAPADTGVAPTVVETPRELSYAYRGMEVRERMEELGLGTAVIELQLEYVATA